MKLNGYDQVELIAKGDMVAVYRARQKAHNRMVAIKFLARSVSGIPEARKRFELESQIIADFDHANIVHIYDQGFTSANTPYFIMEYTPGEGLDRLIREGSLSLRQNIHIATQCAMALEYAHDKGIVHGDIKPGNVIVGDQGKVKIGDFGISDLIGAIENGNPSAYLAPERTSGNASKTRLNDVFSFGAFLRELFTGTKPKPGMDAPHQAPDGVPKELFELTRACMQINPGDRPQTFGEIKKKLLEILPLISAPVPPDTVSPTHPDQGKQAFPDTDPAQKPGDTEAQETAPPSGKEAATPATSKVVPPGSKQKPISSQRRKEDEYWIRNRREIIRILTQLARDTATITTHFNENKRSFLTSVLGLAQKNELLVIDEGPDQKLNAQILKAGRATCRSDDNGIVTKFECENLSRAKFKGRSAIVCPLPKLLFYQERRTSFRVTTPVADPPICYLPVEGQEPLEFSVVDISVGGMCLREITQRLELSPNKQRDLASCVVYIPKFAEITLDLRVCNSRLEKRKDGSEVQIIGVSFLNPPSWVSSAIQRYVTKVQISQIALTKR